MGACVVLMTAPRGRASKAVADALVARRLAACVNVIDIRASVYRWKGKIERHPESLLIAKSRRSLFARLVAAVRRVHPYTVPEILMLPIAAGDAPYLRWLAAETAAKRRRS